MPIWNKNHHHHHYNHRYFYQNLSQFIIIICIISRFFLAESTLDNDSENEKWSCEQLDYCTDKLGFEAIKWLHSQLDDDANGNIDISESDEFLRDELKYENGYERQKKFHGNDKHISVDELWKAWKSSDVRNWTVEETIDWLINHVELPQYTEQFQNNAVDGVALPRMAANSQFLSILGINNPIHKQKIALKAMDVVLFGAPKHHNYVKDVLLVFSLVVAIGGCWFAYVQHRNSQIHIKKMMRDMDSLQKAEEQLMDLQNELDKARREQQHVAMEKVNLEKKLMENEINKEQFAERSASYSGLTDLSRISELEDELRTTREELKRAEAALTMKSWTPPPQQLQYWLQLTHEIELKSYNAKRAAAEKQLLAAKEGCEKLKKKRSTLLGAFRVAHGNSIDDVDNRILQAKGALSEVTKDLQERLHRWRQIESLCGFSIVHNPGLKFLENYLYAPHQGITRTSSEATIDNDENVPLSSVEHLLKKSLPMMMSPATLSLSDKLFNNHIPTSSGILSLDVNNSRRHTLSDISGHNSSAVLSSTLSNETLDDGSASMANFSLGGIPIRPNNLPASYDKASMLSLNLLSNPPLKQAFPPTPSSVMTSSICSSTLESVTHINEEEEEEHHEILSNKEILPILQNSSFNNESSRDFSQISGQPRIQGRLKKSFSQDNYNNKIINHDSESYSELQQLNNNNNDNKSALNSPISSKSRNISATMVQSLDEESGSTDSGSLKEMNTDDLSSSQKNVSADNKKKYFFNIRKRKTTKL